MKIKEIRDWIIHPDTTYVIETEEEYKLVCERVDRLFDTAITASLEETINNLNKETPNMLELNKLVEAIELWDSKR
jgi:hypothetical protein